MLRKAVIILIIALLAFSASAKTTLKVGAIPPSFELPDLKGTNVCLDQYLGNKVIILSFFASWSKSCQQEIAFLQELSREHEDLKVIGISFDRKTKELKSYVEENGIDFEILHDKKLTTLKEYRILIIPTLFVIDKEGNIKSIYVDFDKNVEKAVLKDIEN